MERGGERKGEGRRGEGRLHSPLCPPLLITMCPEDVCDFPPLDHELREGQVWGF